MASNKVIKRKIHIWINGKEVQNNLNSIGREIGKLNSDLRKLTPGTDEFIKKSEELRNAKKAYKEIKDEINQTNVSLQELRGNFDNVLDGLLSGDLKKAKAGLKGIATGIGQIVKQAALFIATPIGAAIAALAGIFFAAKAWVDFNLELEKTNQLVNELTGLSGDAMDAVRIRAEVLRDTFEIDINESIKSAKSLVKNLGVSYDQAFDLIEKAAVKGKHKNDEFLESIQEYPVQFRNAGFSAKEFVDIVSTGIDMEIYSDKLPDAIKEFTLAVTEQTDAARDALTNAFGKEFTDRLFKEMKEGSKTPKEALKEISAEVEKIGLNSQQAQQLTADLFKGAGEDAGGALEIFEAVNTALSDQQKPLTENQRLTQEQLDLNKELKGVYTQIFANGNVGFGKIIKRGKIFFTKVLLKILKAGIGVYNWFVDLNNESKVFSGLLTTIGRSATYGFRALGILVKGAWESFKGLGDIIAGIFDFNWSRIKKGFNRGVGGLSQAIDGLKKEAIKDLKDIRQAFEGQKKMKKFDLKTFVADDVEINTNVTTNTNKFSLENKAKADAFKKGEEAIDKIIADFRRKRELRQLKGLEKEIALINDRYAKLEKKYADHKDKLAQLEELKQQEINDAKLRKQQEYLEKASQLEDENYLKMQELQFEREAEEAISDEEKARILLEKVRWLAMEELAIKEEKELAEIELVEGAEKLKEQIRLKYALARKKIDTDYQKNKAKVDKNQRLQEQALNQQRLQEYSDMFGNIATLLGRNTKAGKAAAIAQATLNTYQGVTEVWATKSTLPEPFATISKIANTGLVLASGLSAVSSIKSTNTPSYFYGGYTGEKAIGKDKYGKITGLVHQNEWVGPEIMTTDPKYAPVFEYLEGERNKILKGYADGGTALKNPSDKLPFDSETESTDSYDATLLEKIYSVLEKLDERLEEGFTIPFGYEELQKLRKLEEDLDDSEAFSKMDNK